MHICAVSPAGGTFLSIPAKKNLLLVEDEAIIAMSQKVQLEKFGYSVLVASSGEKAIDLFTETVAIQLVLMDIDLGNGIDGTIAAARILEVRDVPVVFLSSHTESVVVEKTEKISSYGYVVKNSGMTVLDASIKMAFKLFDANQKISASETKLNSLISNIDDVIGILNDKGVIRYSSPNIEKWYGWQAEELLSLSAITFVHPGDAERIQSDFFSIMVGITKPIRTSFKFRCRNGTYRPVELTATNLLQDTVIDGILLNFHDISGRKLAEERLQEKNEEYEVLNEELRSSMEELQTTNEILSLNSENLQAKEKTLNEAMHFNEALFESIPGYLYVYDEKGKLIKWNKKHEEMTGYSAEELSHMTLADWFEGEDAVRVARAVEEVFRNGFGEVEANLLVKGGKTLLIRSNGVPLTIDGKRYFTGVGIDITKQRKAENALRESEETLQSLVQDIQVGVLLQGPNSEIVLSNPKALELLGLSEEQLKGKTSFDPDWNVIHENGLPFPGADHPVPVAIATRKPVLNTVMGVFHPQRGKRVWLSVHAIPRLSADGSVTDVVCTFIDITENRQGIEERKQNESRLKRLVDVLQHPAETIQDFLDFALDQAIALTGSKIGYIYHYNEERKEFTLNTWSKQVMAECSVIDAQTTYMLEKTGLWGETVRQRKPIVINAFEVPNPLKKGIPEGHVHLSRFMTIPIFRNKEIVGVIGLANKDSDYTEADLLQISLLMDAIWKVTERKKAEEEVKKLLGEKELILKEVHHRIKNNMNTIYSLLNLQAGMLVGTAASEALEDAGRRVQSMMLLYSKLYQSADVTSLSLRHFIPDLTNQILSNFPNRQLVKLEIDIDDICLEAKQLQPVGILINELITNSMKYAFVGRDDGLISIKAFQNGSGINIVIADNGVGMPESVSFESSPGFGLILVSGLAGQLGGNLHLDRSGGTRIVLEFGQ